MTGMQRYLAKDRAYIYSETKEIIKDTAKKKGIKMDSLIKSVSQSAGCISPSAVKTALYGRQRAHVRMINAITEITGIEFVCNRDKWEISGHQESVYDAEKDPQVITQFRYRFEGEGEVNETRAGQKIIKNKAELRRYLKRVARAKRNTINNKPAEYQLLEVNGEQVKQGAIV